jgi:hypothetical protein
MSAVTPEYPLRCSISDTPKFGGVEKVHFRWFITYIFLGAQFMDPLLPPVVLLSRHRWGWGERVTQAGLWILKSFGSSFGATVLHVVVQKISFHWDDSPF